MYNCQSVLLWKLFYGRNKLRVERYRGNTLSTTLYNACDTISGLMLFIFITQDVALWLPLRTQTVQVQHIVLLTSSYHS